MSGHCLALTILHVTCASYLATSAEWQGGSCASFNAMDAYEELVAREYLQIELEVSPAQLVQLRNARQRFTPTLDGLILDAYSDNEKSGLGPQRLATVVRVELNDEVFEVLTEVLDEKQVEALLPTVLRYRYANGPLQVFGNRLVMLDVGVGYSEFENLLSIVLKEQSAYAEKIKALVLESRQQAISQLTTESKKKLSVYTGDSETDEVPLEDLLKRLPFPPQAYAHSAVARVLQFQGLASKMELTPKQLFQLESINSEFMEELRTIRAGRNELRHLQSSYYRKDIEILAPRQQLVFGQHMARQELQLNIEAPFKREDFVEYLELSPKELAEVRVMLEEEKKTILKRVAIVNQRTFSAVTQKLSEAPRERVSNIFENVWAEAIMIPDVEWSP